MSDQPDYDEFNADNYKWHITHTVNFHVAKTWGRTNNLAWTYFELAQDACSELLTLENSPVPNIVPDEDPAEYFAYTRRLRKTSITVIVFSAMACEAAIYDLAAIHLTDDYATRVLDKLDLFGKWLVIPRLICGKSMDENGPAINGLRGLIKARNALVHHKSEPLVSDLKNPDRAISALEGANKRMGAILSQASASFQTLILLSLELNRVLGTIAGSLPFFEDSGYQSMTEDMPKNILEIVHRCREIDAKASLSDSA